MTRAISEEFITLKVGDLILRMVMMAIDMRKFEKKELLLYKNYTQTVASHVTSPFGRSSSIWVYTGMKGTTTLKILRPRP